MGECFHYQHEVAHLPPVMGDFSTKGILELQSFQIAGLLGLLGAGELKPVWWEFRNLLRQAWYGGTCRDVGLSMSH